MTYMIVIPGVKSRERCYLEPCKDKYG